MGFVFGDQSFKKGVFDELLPEVDAAQKGRVVQSKLPIKTVISAVADFYQINDEQITKCIRGRQTEN
jgi:hypothetical protein